MPESWLSRERNRLPPNSARAYLFAVLCIFLATLARQIFGLMGVTLPFVTFFPAIVIIALLAGYQAGMFAIVLTVFIALWFWEPPHFTFEPITLPLLMNFGLFVLAALLIVWIAQKYRDAIDHLHRNERERKLIIRELEHRGKNTHAVVDAIVRGSLEDQPDRADLISGRIRAVSSANDIVNRSETHSATLNSILLNEFAAFDNARVELIGPTVELKANVARKIALVLHELVTNAIKYGSLSSPNGRVLINWKLDANTIFLHWKESGGPEVSEPSRYGFGSRLVTRTLKSLSGTIDPKFNPSGLQCRMNFQLEE